jgi:hypothetical protein
MKDETIRKHWEDFIIKYKKYFLSNEEEWINNLKLVEDYIIKNNKRPSDYDKNIEIKKLGSWIIYQQQNYLKKEYIMKDETIRKHWEDFIIKYKKYFLSNEEEWINNLKLVEDYIIKNNKRPSSSSTNKDIEIKKLGSWIIHQQQNYLKKEYIMKDETIRKHWEDFIIKYKKYFLSNEEEWINNLKLVEDYIIKNNKRPSSHDKDIEIKKLGSWIGTQQQNYLKKEPIMKDETIRKHWEKFIEKYKKYFLSYEDEWLNNLKLVEDYIIKNNKRPSSSDKNKEIRILGKWISHQITNYKSKENIKKNHLEIYNKWTEFINDPIYKNYY